MVFFVLQLLILLKLMLIPLLTYLGPGLLMASAHQPLLPPGGQIVNEGPINVAPLTNENMAKHLDNMKYCNNQVKIF